MKAISPLSCHSELQLLVVGGVVAGGGGALLTWPGSTGAICITDRRPVLPACGLASAWAREATAIYLPVGNFPDPQQAGFPWVWAAQSGAVYHGQQNSMGSP